MGKLRDAARRLIQSKTSIQGKKRDLGWKMISIVTMMGFLALFQLVILEHRWYSSSSQLEKFSSLPNIVGFTKNTALKLSSAKSTGSDTGSQHAVLPSKCKQSYLSLIFIFEIRACLKTAGTLSSRKGLGHMYVCL